MENCMSGFEVEHGRVQVRSLEAIDGTPIVDVKPALSPDVGRR
jgi:tRNA (Thr-GGU) A37 N-methylase